MEDKMIIVVDSQKLSMIQNCACKYDYVFNKNLVPIEQAFAIERGSLIHHMLETYHILLKYKSRWSLSTPENPKAAWTLRDVIKCCIRVGEYAALRMSIQIEEVEEAVNTFVEYINFWHDKDKYEILAVERVGSKILYEDEELVIIYETKIDLITRSPGLDILPWDTKTYSRRSPINTLDNQFIGYCWMLDTRNIIVNKVGFQKTLPPDKKYYREMLSYPKQVIDSWAVNAVWWIRHLLALQNSNEWPQNFTSCVKFNKDCQFMEVCKQPQELRGWKAAQLFNISEETWDIGAKL